VKKPLYKIGSAIIILLIGERVLDVFFEVGPYISNSIKLFFVVTALILFGIHFYKKESGPGVEDWNAAFEDADKYLKFKEFKEFVKNILNEPDENIDITIVPYKWDTIEQQETFCYSDLYWEGIKYSGSWDSIVKNAVFHFDLEYQSIKDFYEIIKTHKSLDELKGDDFNLIPVEDSGAHRENIKINWERPLTKEELKAFEEYGGAEKLVWETDDYDNVEVIIGRISSISIFVGKESFIIEA